MIKIESFLEDTGSRSARLARPVITLSYAQSLDGCLSVGRGRRTGMSGPQSMRLTHRLRAAHQAILVGIGTILADDPRLTVRLVEGPDPVPVVVDTSLRIPERCSLLQRSENLPWIIHGGHANPHRQESLEKIGAKLIPCKLNAAGRIELAEALRLVYENGIETMMVEGGAGIITSFLAGRLFDQAVITLCPFWLGGLPAVGEALVKDACWPALANPAYEQAGEDLIVYGELKEARL
jgi:3,4-dihydroxy 2-butanone 4-phosphate synthase/GTP cyclohydrolase II